MGCHPLLCGQDRARPSDPHQHRERGPAHGQELPHECVTSLRPRKRSGTTSNDRFPSSSVLLLGLALTYQHLSPSLVAWPLQLPPQNAIDPICHQLSSRLNPSVADPDTGSAGDLNLLLLLLHCYLCSCHSPCSICRLTTPDLVSPADPQMRRVVTPGTLMKRSDSFLDRPRLFPEPSGKNLSTWLDGLSSYWNRPYCGTSWL